MRLVTGIGVGAVVLPLIGFSPRLRAAGVQAFPFSASRVLAARDARSYHSLVVAVDE
jgi:hypothetical protein